LERPGISGKKLNGARSILQYWAKIEMRRIINETVSQALIKRLIW
jgi:hypothetical protein